MTVDLLKKIIQDRPRECALMGIDVGSKTLGIAVCDSAQSIAFPLTTLKRTKFSRDIQDLEKIMAEYGIGGFIIGYPLNMDGSIGPRAQSVRDFALELSKQISLQDPWIALWDERLSTASVEDFVDKIVDIKKRRAKERGIIDKLAAQHILQGALAYIHQNAG